MSSTILKIENLYKEFPSGEEKIQVLKNINLDIQAQDMIAIIGASGSGKSTLMNILGCLDKPSSGDYYVDSVPVSGLGKDELAKLRRDYFGFIFQRYHLLPSSKAVENVEIPAIYSGTPSATRRQRAIALLEKLGLAQKIDNRPNQLSGGQQQRVSIARALMNGGQVILADEPTGALDSHSGEQVMQILLDLNATGHTIIIVTHDPEVAAHARRIIEIKDGEILSDTVNTKWKPHISSEKSPPTSQNILAPSSPPNKKWKLDSLKEAFAMATKAIYSHKMRSFLTMLGIIIGIASVASVVALGAGSRQKILSDISSMGTNTVDIYPGAGFGDRRAATVRTLNSRDASVLAQQNYVNSVSPGVSAAATVVYQNVVASAQIKGVGQDFFQVKGIEIEAGQQFGAEAVAQQAQVAVIDKNTQKKLFPNTTDSSSILGQVIISNSVPLKIIGVAKEQKAAFGYANDSLNIWVPYTTVMTRISGVNYLQSLTVRINDNSNAQAAEDSIKSILTARHGSTDFFTVNSDSIKETVEKTTATLTVLISAIAVISLIVGGIGVMNIMLVSVTERTSEIGVRMAIGARQSDILQQFLIEAILICLLGGALGVGLALLIGAGFNAVSTSFSMIYSWNSIALALFCSTAIGIIFGFIPAKNASELDPIVALSRE